VHLAYAEDEDDARRAAHEQWRQNALPSSVMGDLRHPAQFVSAARHVRPEDMDSVVRISADPARHAEWLQRDVERGFDGLFLHEVGPRQERFIETFGREVLPAVRGTGVAVRAR
jgi:alkanesulfonate monooxygenase SsuD/methylene tetrahydromethanopterin reductase-like flavin-dependent oxidoreductase (luciferase family)